MKIPVYGAGVIKSIYAAKLFEAKNEVTLLARGKRNNVFLKYSSQGTN